MGLPVGVVLWDIGSRSALLGSTTCVRPPPASLHLALSMSYLCCESRLVVPFWACSWMADAVSPMAVNGME